MIREKIAQAIDILREKNIDLWLTFERESKVTRDPMHGFIAESDVTWQTAFIITATGEALVIAGNLDVAELAAQGHYSQVHSYVQSIREPLLATLNRINPASIAINYSQNSPVADGLTLGLYRELQAHLQNTPFAERLISAEPVINALRGRKTDAEIERMRKAAHLTLDIFSQVGSFIRPGKTEKEIAAFVLEKVDRAGLETSWSRQFCPAVFTGPDTAGAHAAPTDRQVQTGHLVNMDFGVKFDGYCADLQRTWYVPHPGEGVPDAVTNGFRVLRAAIDSAADAIKPGVLGADIDAIARGFLEKNGYEGYPHGLGHQLGREPHDGGALLAPAWDRYGQTPFTPIEAGQVFTIEPRLFVPQHGTVTIEEEIWVRENGVINIDTPQRELWIVQ